MFNIFTDRFFIFLNIFPVIVLLFNITISSGSGGRSFQKKTTFAINGCHILHSTFQGEVWSSFNILILLLLLLACINFMKRKQDICIPIYVENIISYFSFPSHHSHHIQDLFVCKVRARGISIYILFLFVCF